MQRCLAFCKSKLGETKAMKLATIIVNYNNAKETINYVKQIREFENIERIVVVDNASTELNTMRLLKEVQNEKVLILQSGQNGGYSYGNNFGIRHLEAIGETYDAILISNADIKIEKTAIDRCLEILEKDEKIAIVAPRMYHPNLQPIRRSSWKIRTFFLDLIHSTRLLELLFYPKLRAGEYSEKQYAQDLLEVEAISGAFFIVKYPIFKEIGMFDETVFLFYEEDILAKKLQEKGYKIVSVNDVKCIHYESQTIGKTLSYYHKMKQLYKSKIYYHKTYQHMNKGQMFLFQVLYIFRNIELILEIPIRKMLKK